ncbi:MAG: hypothetical protein RL323_1291 [Pseudomonadota bacterium]
MDFGTPSERDFVGNAPPPPVQTALARPLYVDLDGTLCVTDTLHESLVLMVRTQPWLLLLAFFWLFKGKAYFKREVAKRCMPEAGTLPYHPEFMAWLQAQQTGGRPLILATAADEAIAQSVFRHVGLFDALIASNTGEQAGENRVGALKLQALQAHVQARYGTPDFAYAGNSTSDLAVWACAQEAIAVNTPAQVLRQLQNTHPNALVFEGPATGWRTWRKALRLQQWAKNILLFIPAVAAHQWAPHVWSALGLAFLAFGLCASATYLLNDLFDIPNDRKHKTKRHRPLASGSLSVAAAVPMLGTLLLVAFALAASYSWALMAVLACYTATTVAYSFKFKRTAVLDVLLLASLYTMRLIAGAVTANVQPSNWLLAISMFLFLSLALVKRCSELEEVIHLDDTETARGRGYHQDDLPSLRSMGIGSGFLAVLVLALYIDSQNGQAQYPQVGWLWGVAPIMLWWVMRIWLKTGRRELQGEDPLQFALHDRFSWWTLAAMAVLAFMATRRWGF